MDPRHAPPVPAARTDHPAISGGGGGIIARSLLQCVRSVGATVLALTLVWGSTSAAHATPEPDHGPESGGISVTVPAPAGTAYERIAAGSFQSVGLGPDGTADAWGQNGFGQLGDGSTTDRLTPVKVAVPAGVTFASVAAGNVHSVGIGADGNAYAWGWNGSGELGDGSTEIRSTPVRVAMPAGVTLTSVSAGYSHSVGIGSDGNTYSWGRNGSGQLGDGSTAIRSTPAKVAVPAGVTLTSVSAGHAHSVGIGSDGNTYAWGRNGGGQLGDGSTADRSTPVRVAVPAGVTLTSVSAGYSHSLGIGSDGNTYAWGWSDVGQVGDGSTAIRSTPVKVAVPAGVTLTSVSAGDAHSLGIGSDGNTYAWGWNRYGQLGEGTDASRLTPVKVAMPVGVTLTSVSAGAAHSVGVGSDGSAYAWGYNESGQVGDGTTTNRLTPVLVSAPRVVVTEITFDGVPGTELRDNGDGTWSVAAPAHTAGVVEVLVFWTANGVARTPVSSRFTYDPTQVAPTITDPRSSSVRAGDTAKFSVTTTGTPTPAVSWQVSRDGGASWEDPSETPDPDGQSLTVVGSEANHGFRYRAVAVNSAGSATSRAAELSVVPRTTTAPPQGTDPPKRTTPSKGTAPSQGTVLPNGTAAEPGAHAGGHPSVLASTGSAGASLPVAVAAAVLFLGGGATVVARSTVRRMAK